MGRRYEDDYDWHCTGCGAEWFDEEIRVEDQCPTCGARFCLVWIGPDR